MISDARASRDARPAQPASEEACAPGARYTARAHEVRGPASRDRPRDDVPKSECEAWRRGRVWRFVSPPGGRGGRPRRSGNRGACGRFAGRVEGGRTDPTRAGSRPRARLCVSTASGSTPSSAEPESARREGAGALRARLRLALRKCNNRDKTPASARHPIERELQPCSAESRSGGRRDRRVVGSSIIEFL